MKTCPNCSTTQDDAAAFCAHCGAAIPAAAVPQADVPRVCSGCGAPIDKADVFCQECGTMVAAAQTARTYTAKDAAKPKKLPAKFLMLAAAAVVVVAAVIIGIFVLKPSGKSTLIYLKDGELSMTGVNKIAPFQLTESLYEDSDAIGYYAYVDFSDDGKYLFYPENISAADSSFDLYCINMKVNNAKNSSSVKIDSGVSSYRTSLDGTKVFYLKSDKLYFFDLKEKVKIDSDVDEFYIRDDGQKLMYVDSDGTLYSKDMKGENDAVKIDSDVMVQHVAEDLSKVYYIKNDNLYLKETDKEKVKIDSDVGSVPAFYDTGALYYIKSATKEVPYYDYVDDDLANSDAAMKEPSYEDFITKDSYGYSVIDYDAYYDASDAYYEKLDRDALRDELKQTMNSVTEASLYYYDAKESVKVTDSYSSYMSSAADKPMLAYSKYQSGDIPKMNLADISSSYDVQQILDGAMDASSDTFISIGAKETPLDLEEASEFEFNNAGTMVYILDSYSYEDASGDLYTAAITGDTVSTPTLYEEGVSYILYVLGGSDSLLYFKDIDNETDCGDLYIDKNNIDSDVHRYSIRPTGGKESLIYRTDVNPDDYIGTLKEYDGKKSVRIADDVRNYLVNDNGVLAYITNFDTDDGTGDAYLYNGGRQPKLIEKDVTGLLSIG